MLFNDAANLAQDHVALFVTGVVVFALSAAVLVALGLVLSFRRRRPARGQESPHVLLE